MTRAYIYFALFIAGTLVPNIAFVPWVMDHGFDVSRLLEELFVNRVSAAFALDLTMTAIVLAVFMIWEGRRVGVRLVWLPILLTFTVGVSCGVPLFLFLRELRLRPSTKLGA